MGVTISPTFAVDGADTVQSGCQPRITDNGKQYFCYYMSTELIQLSISSLSTATFAGMVIDWLCGQHRN